MFSLIISIIAIALVAALALASIYYGGTAFQEGSADAEASTVVNQGQQIQAAFTLADVDEYSFDTANVDDSDDMIDDLVAGEFLKEAPSVRGKDWIADKGDGTATLIEVPVVNADVCAAIEDRFDGSETLETVDGVANVAASQAFGCIEESLTAGTYTAYYKL